MKRQLYQKYKSSGVEWLGNVPEHWDVKRARFMISMNPTKQEILHLSPDTEVSFLPMEAVGDDGSLNLETNRPISEVSSGYTYFAEGDVTFAKITPCFENGKGAIMRNLYNGFGFGTTELTVLRTDKKVDKEYLYYLTISREFRKNGEAWMYGAGGQKRVPDDFVKEFRFSWPPLSEQQDIAKYLDCQTEKIDTLVEKKKRLVELLKEKRTALISHAVTKGLNPKVKMKPSGVEWLGDVPEHWEVASLRRYLYVQSGDMTSASDLIDEGYPVFGGNGFRGYIDKWNTEVKTIIIGRYGALCGNVRITEERTWATEHAFRVFALKDFHVEYFAQLLTMLDLNKFSARAAQPGLNSDIVRNNTVTIPPLNEQQAIAEYLDQETGKIDGLIAKVEEVIEKLKEYRTALISAAVTGKIDVREAV